MVVAESARKSKVQEEFSQVPLVGQCKLVWANVRNVDFILSVLEA